jgi:hypothetical protein
MPAIAAGLALALTLVACGNKSAPDASAPQSATANGQVGQVSASGATSTSPANSASTSGGGGNQNPYPSNAKDYGLAFLQAVAAKNDPKIVDLASLSVANDPNMSFYKSTDGNWTFTDCQTGSPVACHYYNQTGSIATVGVDSGKLGKAGAVSYLSVEGGSLPNDPGGYVLAFGAAWDAGNYAKMVSLSSTTVADHFRTTQTLVQQGAAGTSYSGAHPCTNNASKTCVDLTPVGGTTNPAPIQFVVDTSKISQAKPNGITGWV